MGARIHDPNPLLAQDFPNAPNVPHFPSALATPKKPLHEVTEFRFLVAK